MSVTIQIMCCQYCGQQSICDGTAVAWRKFGAGGSEEAERVGEYYRKLATGQ